LVGGDGHLAYGTEDDHVLEPKRTGGGGKRGRTEKDRQEGATPESVPVMLETDS
jgi:hypothetical protein